MRGLVLVVALSGMSAFATLGGSLESSIAGRATAVSDRAMAMGRTSNAGVYEAEVRVQQKRFGATQGSQERYVSRFETAQRARPAKSAEAAEYEAHYRNVRSSFSWRGAVTIGALLGLGAATVVGVTVGSPLLAVGAAALTSTAAIWSLRELFADNVTRLWTRIRYGRPPEGADLGPPPVIAANPEGKPTKYPIVLVHGIQGSLEKWTFEGVPEALAGTCEKVDLVLFCEGGGDGQQVMVAQLPPYAGVEARAEFLAEQIDLALAHFGTNKVNIVAHSMAGLDARCVISNAAGCDQGKDYGAHIASLTTISTPHAGTPIIDRLGKFAPKLVVQIVHKVFQWMGSHSDLGDIVDVPALLHDLSSEGARQFNQEHPLDPRVEVFEWRGIASAPWAQTSLVDDVTSKTSYRGYEGATDTMDPITWMMAWLQSGLSDGIVPSSSAQLDGPQVHFMGYIPADHPDQVDSKGPDEVTGYDSVTFFRNLAFDLADWGY